MQPQSPPISLMTQSSILATIHSDLSPKTVPLETILFTVDHDLYGRLSQYSRYSCNLVNNQLKYTVRSVFELS